MEISIFFVYQFFYFYVYIEIYATVGNFNRSFELAYTLVAQLHFNYQTDIFYTSLYTLCIFPLSNIQQLHRNAQSIDHLHSNYFQFSPIGIPPHIIPHPSSKPVLLSCFTFFPISALIS